MAEPKHSAIWRLLSTQPDLLAKHASAYGALIEEQLVLKLAGWRRTLLRQMALLLALGVAWVSAEVAVMLWVTSTAPGTTATLVVVVVAALFPAAVALVLCLQRATPATDSPTLSELLQTQLKADWSVLQDSTP